MFQELHALLQSSNSIVLSIAKATEGSITVTVMPKSNQDSNEPSLATPFRLTGTPAELDQEFGNLLTNYTNQRASLAEQAEATVAILNEAKKTSEKKATKALSKPITPSKSTEPPAGGKDSPEDNDDGEGSSSDSASTPASETPAADSDENLWG